MLMPLNDPGRPKPLDHPSPQRPHRLYVALTNCCNRACPWCSTCSSPQGSTWLQPQRFASLFPSAGTFQVQLEGGEPTLHPQFWEFVDLTRQHPRCTLLVLCTNGVVLPRVREKLRAYVQRLGQPLTIKLSINHHLLDHDPGLIQLAINLRDIIAELAGDRLLVINVRLRRGQHGDDEHVRRSVEDAGPMPCANVFYLHRYGFAADQMGWEPPLLVWDGFTLVNPDGQIYAQDLLARSEAMRRLP